jgi:hypothetical protein
VPSWLIMFSLAQVTDHMQRIKQNEMNIMSEYFVLRGKRQPADPFRRLLLFLLFVVVLFLSFLVVVVVLLLLFQFFSLMIIINKGVQCNEITNQVKILS